MTKWVSASKAVKTSIPEEDMADVVKDQSLDRENLPFERVLGMQ